MAKCGWCITGDHKDCVKDTYAKRDDGFAGWTCTCPTCNPTAAPTTTERREDEDG